MEKKKITRKIRIRIAILFGIIALIASFPLTWQGLKGNTPKEISHVERNLKNLFESNTSNSKADLDLPSWGKVKRITNPLIFENRRIAQAKALLHYKRNPYTPPPKNELDPLAALIFKRASQGVRIPWENRYQLSKQKWQIQTITSKTLTSLGISIASSIATMLSVFLILTIVPWLWYFILGRIGELSQSVQGKSDS